MALPSAPFNTADSIINGLSIIAFKPANTAVTGIAVAITTGIATKTAHGLKVGQQFIVTALTGGTGITINNYYWVVSAPTADTFTFSDTRGGAPKIPTAAASAMTIQPVHVFEVASLTGKGTLEEKELMRPDSKGVMWPARTWVGKAGEEDSCEIDDVKRLLLLFNGAMRGRLSGTATKWIPDVDDVTGKCALVSESDWPCTLTTDGDQKFGGGEATKAGLKFKSNKIGYITYTADATV